MEGFEALQTLDNARGKIWIGRLGAPAVAWLWAYTSSLAARFDAGRFGPSRIPGSAEHLIAFVYDYLALGLYLAVGKIGLHLVFGGMIAVTLGVGAWGRAQRRALEQRVGSKVLQDLQTARLVKRRPALAAKLEASQRRPRIAVASRSITALVMLAFFRLLPLTSIALTILFTWMALTRRGW